MLKFVQAISTSQAKRAASKRDFRTFRRDKQCTVPGWAFNPTGAKPTALTSKDLHR